MHTARPWTNVNRVVSRAQSMQESTHREAPDTHRKGEMSSKLFVGGLSHNTDDTTLRAAFDQYGELTEARVILDRDTNRSRGFGFVRYATPEQDKGALEKMNGAAVDGRTIRDR